ncbi:MAG: glycosyltransferase [Sulfuricellaceae bacterium]
MKQFPIPSQAVKRLDGSRVLVFASHPGDEVFGCGGTILCHVAAEDAVRVIIVSDGGLGADEENRAEYARIRQNESSAAAALLGYGAPEFWMARDVETAYGEKLVSRVLEAMRQAGADLVYAPSVFETQPDHRDLGLAVVEAVRRLGTNVRLALYEAGVPLHPNLLLDISALVERKRLAMECYASSPDMQRHGRHIAALNNYRSDTLPAEVTAAEAYLLVSCDALARDPLELFRLEHNRQQTPDNRDKPLVSIIIRSMDRPVLSDALDSVALQTYPNIEVVLVNAKGEGHRDVGAWCGRFPLALVGAGEKLRRSRAANLGMESARGEYLIFLDDDDWFEPDHIEKLVAAFGKNPYVKVVYSGVKCVDSEKNPLPTEFSHEFDAIRLLAENFIPIHAVLFSRSLFELGCRVDESLDLYEDWDFWIQLARHADFLFVGGLSAVYRITQQSGFGVNAQPIDSESATLVIYKKWRNRLEDIQLPRIMRAVLLNRVKDQQLKDKDAHIERLSQAVQEIDRIRVENEAEHNRTVAAIQAEHGRIIAEQNAGHDRTSQAKDAEHHRALSAINAKLEQERIEFDRCIRRQWTNLTVQLSHKAELERQLFRERDVVQDLRGQLAVKAGEATLAAARTANLEKRLRTLLSSRSWRVTAPLRATVRLMRGDEQVDDEGIASMNALPVPPVVVEAPPPAPPSFVPSADIGDAEYRDYLACFRPCDDLTDEVRWAMRAQIDAMKYRPVIAVRFSLLGLDDETFQRAFDAVRYQLYPGWELWLVDGEWASERQKTLIREAMEGDGRIKFALNTVEGLDTEISPDPLIEREYIYVLTPQQIPPELAMYRLAFFLIKHNYSQRDNYSFEERFTRWLERNDDATALKIRALKSPDQALPASPLISVIMPVYNTPEKWLRQAINSVLNQFYRNWELCIVDDNSSAPHVRAVLEEYCAKDARIKVVFCEVNQGVSKASNMALHQAGGQFVVLMDHDDIIEKLALFLVAQMVAAEDPDMFYSDEAVVDEHNRKALGLVFRPAFSKEFLRAHPYIVHMVGFKREFLLALGGFDETLKISHDYDLMLRASERAQTIVHIPAVLYRWRTHAGSAGHEKMDAVTAASLEILARHLERCGEQGQATEAAFFNYYDIRYPLQPGLRVAIVIPTKNHGDLVRQCIAGIERTVKEVAYDIVLIDHDSNDDESLAYFNQVAKQHRVLHYSGPFNFSSINNFAVAQLDGGYTHILFCNNDIEAIEDGWLERMLELGQHRDVGVVGAKLFYPDMQMIQHAGVIVGMNGIAGHAGQFMAHTGADGNPEKGYLGRLMATHEQMAVTAACMLVRRDVFDQVHGYDEDLAVGFGDTDLCLRIFLAGYRVMFCPHAVLVHHESYTRGKSTSDPHPEDSLHFREKWAKVLDNGDPYYNPNLSINCSWWEIGENPTLGIEAKRRVYRKAPMLPAGGYIDWS